MSSNENNMILDYDAQFATKVAIIGRPNVGKSTLFNILTNSRKSVVKNQPGVTRDILIEPVDVWGKKFDLIDTGGLTESQDLFSKLIKEQVTDFLFTVDFILLSNIKSTVNKKSVTCSLMSFEKRSCDSVNPPVSIKSNFFPHTSTGSIKISRVTPG